LNIEKKKVDQRKEKIMMVKMIKIQVQYEDELDLYVQNNKVLLMDIIELMNKMISYHQLEKIEEEFYYKSSMKYRSKLKQKYILNFISLMDKHTSIEIEFGDGAPGCIGSDVSKFTDGSFVVFGD